MRLPAIVGLFGLALGCQAPNAAVELSSESPVLTHLADGTTKEFDLIGQPGLIKYASFDIDVLADDIDGDGELDDAYTVLLVSVSDTPGCRRSLNGLHRAVWFVFLEDLNVGELGPTGNLGPGTIIQGEGGTLNPETGLFDSNGLFAAAFVHFNEGPGAIFLSLDDDITSRLEINAIDEQRLSVDVTSHLVLDSSVAEGASGIVPVDIDLAATIIGAKRCEHLFN
jgi:hypothetical protein